MRTSRITWHIFYNYIGSTVSNVKFDFVHDYYYMSGSGLDTAIETQKSHHLLTKWWLFNLVKLIY